MAKSNEVDLVIRARNEASKTLKAVVDAFQDFKSEMDGANGAATKTNTNLTTLGSTLGNLLREAKGLNALSAITKNMDEAAGAVKRMSSALNAQETSFVEISRTYTETARRSAALRDELETQRSLLGQTKTARDAERDSLKRYSEQIKEVKGKLKDLRSTVKDSNKTDRLAQSSIEGPSNTSRGTELVAELKRLEAQQTNAKAAITAYGAAIESQSADIAKLAPILKVSEEYERKLNSERQKSVNVLNRETETLQSTKGELAQIKAVYDQATAAIGRQTVNQEELAKATAHTAAETARVKTQLETLNSAKVTTPTTDNKGVIASFKAYREAQVEVKRLADEMRNAEQPTAELGAALGRAQAQAKLTAQAYEQNIASMRKASATQSSIGDFLARTASAQQRSTTAQVRALAQAERAARSGSSAQQQLANSTQTTLPPIRAQVQALQSVSNASQQAATRSNSLRDAMKGIYGESRQSLSLFQRMRGELLSLTTSYIGLQAAISNISGVVNAFQTLEAAQARLGVAFNGNTTRVSAELDFLQRNAERLGISFEVLANQYSKFAVAAKGANFESKTTRDIFLSVAEAGRVQRLSVDQLEGVFKALEQMISKSKVSAEELRGQLGDRMTGAFKLFADALGVTTQELDSMMKKGEVLANQDTLSKVGERLRQVYGPQLASTLASTSAEIGRFQNNIFQSQLQVAKGGFMVAFTEALRTLNDYFQSTDGVQFFTSLGAALGNVTTAIVTLLPYADELVKGLALLAGLRLARTFADVVTSLRNTATATATANAGMFTWQGTIAATQGRWNAFVASLQVGTGAFSRLRAEYAIMRTLAPAVGGGFVAMRIGLATLTTAAGLAAGTFRLLWQVIGGLPGLILTGVTVAIGQWATRVDDTTKALTEHERILSSVRAAYESVEGTTKKVADNIKGATLAQALASAEQLRKKYEQIASEMQSISRVLFAGFADFPSDSPQLKQFREIEEALKRVKDGTGSIKELSDVLNNVALNPTDEQFKEISLQLLNMVNNAGEGKQSLIELYDALQQADAIVNTFKNSATEADKAVIQGKENIDEAADATRKITEDNKKFNDALKEIGKSVPAIAEELKRMETIEGLNKQYQDALKLARTMGQVMQLTDQYNKAMTATTFGDLGGSGDQASFNLIRKFEGFSATPYWDVNAYRAGFGSDTVTLADGSIQKITQGMTVTMTDAIRDLTRRVQEFQNIARNEVGADRFESFGPQQQAVLTSLAYNYGNLGATGKLDTFKNGSTAEIAEAIRSLGSHNGGVNVNRRTQEANLFENGGDFTERQYEVERKRLDTQQQYNAGLNERLSIQEAENANEGKLTQEAFVQKKLLEEQAKAKKAGVDLTAEQIERIKTAAAEEYRLKQTTSEEKDDRKEANLALQQAQALLQQRNALEAQYQAARKTGDLAAQDEAASKLIGVNAQLQEAIDKARAMWQAIGGPEADVALTKLDTLSAKTVTAKNKMSLFGLSTNQVAQLTDSFADGLTGVFDTFAQSIANGENALQALGKAFLQFAADFLRQIATMILKQMILNALQGFGLPVGGVGVAHSGGVAGAQTRNRMVSPAMFAGAMRYHTGGVAGLRSNEIPAILERGETIRTESQEEALQDRINSPQQQGGGVQTIRNVITMDPSFARDMVNSPQGEKAILSVLSKNKSKLQDIMGG